LAGFNAGVAANLIAAQITSDGAGFFVYLNSALGVPRLVYSTNLNDNTSDLKILARMTNLDDDALPQFTEANFVIDADVAVPEPSAFFLTMAAGGLLLAGARFGRVRRRPG
jgi:hypothetical protein